MDEITFPEMTEIGAEELQAVSGGMDCGYIRDGGGKIIGVACKGPKGGVIWF